MAESIETTRAQARTGPGVATPLLAAIFSYCVALILEQPNMQVQWCHFIHLPSHYKAFSPSPTFMLQIPHGCSAWAMLAHCMVSLIILFTCKFI